MMRLLLPGLLLVLSGCGTATCLSVAEENPKVEVIYGGVRTDINCIRSGDEYWKAGKPELHYVPEYLAKVCSAIDLPLSLVADTLMLPRTIWLTTHKEEMPPTAEPAQSPANASEKQSHIPSAKPDSISPAN